MTPGAVLAHRFEIEALVGQGGMGTVYRARDRDTGDVVALKIMSGQSDEAARRFARESHALAELRHPGVVRYVAHGALPDGVGYLAMEWVEGETLGARLERSGLTLGESVAVVRRIAEALGAAHRRGIVHRDVKPSNILLSGGSLEHVKIVDFGLARHVQGEPTLTITGAVVGTPSYMAPEQARGEADVDARADVFALGCVLFRCLTGRGPFAAELPHAILLKLVLEEAPPVTAFAPDVPEAVAAVVHRMLAKSAAKRPCDANEVAEELSAVALGESASAGPRSVRKPELTGSEQRVVAMVVARPEPLQVAGVERSTLVNPAMRRRVIEADVARHHGSLDVLADGTLVVSIEGPGAATDQAIRAARCALAVRELVPDAPFVLAFGRGTAQRSAAMGDVIERCVRFLDADPPGRVRVDASILPLLEGHFELAEDAGGTFLHREREEATTARLLLGKPTACVGRDHELSTLASILEQSIEEPCARAVLVTAPAGAGKSRLRAEFARRVRQRGGSVSIFTAQGDPMSAGSPLGMIARMIRGLAGLREGDSAESRERSLRARVARCVPAANLERVTEFLAVISGVALSSAPSTALRAARENASLMGEQMRTAWKDFVSAEASRSPVLMVLEDLHWADVSTVKFVDELLHKLADQPLCVLALARPEVREAYPKLWAGRALQELPLRELGKKASEKIVLEALGSKPPELVARIVERAAGNPFYLEELVRATAAGRSDTLPDSVLATVQARLDDLDPVARRILRAASVFGRIFWRAGLLALLGGGGGMRGVLVSEWLAVLEEREIIERRAASTFPGDDEYAFRHALLRDAAHATLLDADLEIGHRLAGAFLESAGESDAKVLALHFDRGGDSVRASACYQRAAESALASNQVESALSLAVDAIRCGASGVTLGELEFVQAEALYWIGDTQRARGLASGALAKLPPGSQAWCKASSLFAAACVRLGDSSVLPGLAEQLDFEPDEAVANEHTSACARVIVQLLFAGKRAEAARLGRRMDAAEPSELGPMARAFVLRARALSARLFEDDVCKAFELHSRSVGDFLAVGARQHASIQQVNAAFMDMELGRFEEAIALLRGVLIAADALRVPWISALARLNLGYSLANIGDVGGGCEQLERAIAEMASSADSRMEGVSLAYLARVRLLAGDVAGAESAVTASIARLDPTPPLRAFGVGVRADVLLAAGQSGEALAAATEAMGTLEDIGWLEEGEALVRVVHAEALGACGRTDEAVPEIRLAESILLERAAKISDPETRAKFLGRVPENARTVQAARRFLRS